MGKFFHKSLVAHQVCIQVHPSNPIVIFQLFYFESRMFVNSMSQIIYLKSTCCCVFLDDWGPNVNIFGVGVLTRITTVKT
jgi:hypothetical protein